MTATIARLFVDWVMVVKRCCWKEATVSHCLDVGPIMPSDAWNREN